MYQTQQGDMKKQSKSFSGSNTLRLKAETSLKGKPKKVSPQLSETENLRLIHELEVHQIELEMQNEELTIAKERVEAASHKYSDLYDFAPSGYFTVSKEGKILELNLSGSQMLGKERTSLINTSFGFFISSDNRQIFDLFLRRIFNSRTQETCEVTLSVKENPPKYVYLTGIIADNGEQCVINAVDISKRRTVEEALRVSEEQNRNIILQTAMDGFWLVDSNGYLLEVNETYCQMSGYTKQELLGKHISDFEAVEAFDDTALNIEKILLNGDDRFETQHRRKDGSIFDIEISVQYQQSQDGRFVAFIHDITERKIADKYREMTREILQILNEQGDIADLTQDVLTVLKTGAAFDAVAIRLQDGDDFPYLAQKGFPCDFLLTENALVSRNRNGGICRDKNGNARLECTCGLVISGMKDQKNFIFTPGGSWWTNDSSLLLAIPTSKDPRFNPRNRCTYLGFGSIALVPIRSKDRNVGLLQFNDQLKNRFTKNIVEKLEGIASHIGAALMRKQAEEALKENERLLRESQAVAHIGSYSVDLIHKTWKASPEIYEIFGIDETYPHSLETWVKSIHPDFQEQLAKELFHDVNNRKYFEHEYKIIRNNDRSHRWVHGHGEFVYDNQMKPVRLIGTIQEITERKQANEALRENEQRLKYHFENSPLAVVEWGNDFVVTQWSIEAERIFGWNKEETVGNRIDRLNLIYEDDIHDVNLVMKKLTSGIENTVISINRNLTKSGSIIDCIWYNSILLDQNGQMSSVMSLVQDITKQRKAEEALKKLNQELETRVIDRTAELLKLNSTLRQTEQKYRTVADHTYDWEYWISEKGQIQYMSPSVKRITGYSADEFITNPQMLSQIVFQDDIRIWKSHTAQSHIPDSDKKNDEIEFRIVTKTNDIRWIAHICKGIFLHGKYHGLRVSNRDITEKVNAENELINVTIEVEERERNRFSLELHDDLGPLLSTIKLYFQWLSETNDPKKMKIITERGNNSINRAIQTTREIAHGLGTQILNNVGFVGAILQFIQSINETQKLFINYKYNSTERFGNLLEITLYRITTELINNTIKYAHATRVEMASNCDKERNTIIFTYIDNGVGFNHEEIEKKDKGLGLLNIQQRIKLAGGSFSLETSVGNGISVSIQLPIDKTIKQVDLSEK